MDNSRPGNAEYLDFSRSRAYNGLKIGEVCLSVGDVLERRRLRMDEYRKEEDTLDIPGFEGVPRALMGEIDNVLFIVFTTRFMKNDEYYRIISARAALKKKIDAYKRHRGGHFRFMEAAMTYIHYGSDHFDPALFVPARNGGLEYGFRPKPADGTGLWASREGDPNGWEAWCRGAEFHLDALNQSFRFTLPEAKILLLEDPEQLIALPKLHPWEPKKPLELTEGELPTMEQLKEWFVPNWCYLDLPL